MKEKKTEVITFRTTPEIKRILEDEAETKGWSLSQITEKIITQYISEKQKPNQINFISNNIKTVTIN